MKRSVLLLFTFSILLFLSACQPVSPPLQAEEEQISGAYEALNFFGLRTTYPNDRIPDQAFLRAWQDHQRMPDAAVAERGIGPWEAMGPVNRGGRTLILEFNPQNPNTLWIGTASGGLWRSYTEGLGAEAWEYVDIGFPVLGVSSIAFAPGDSTTLYIGTGEVYNYQAAGTGAAYRSTRGSYGMGIFKSTDGGVSWELSLDWSYDQNRGIWDIAVDPQNSNIVFAATTHGVYKSIDAGANWERVLNLVMANDLVIHPTNSNLILAGIGNLGSPGKGMFRSEDGGESWQSITQNIPPTFQGKIQLSHAPSNPDIVYASIGNGFTFQDGATWLLRSTDFGATWTQVNDLDYSRWQGWFAHDIGVSIDDPNELVLVGIEAWRSTNGGQTIVPEADNGGGPDNPAPDDNSFGDEVHSDCHDVKYHPTNPNIVYVVSDGGVHRSIDRGQTYQFANGGLQNVQFYNGFSNAVQDASFCLGGLQDNGTIRWNGDNTWTKIAGGDGAWTAINPQDPGTYYASSQYLNVRRIREGEGTVFMDIPEIPEEAFIAPYVVCPTDGNIIYAGSAAMAKTTDGGDNWALTNNNSTLDGNPILSIGVTHNPDVVYCATAPTTIFGGIRGNFFVTIDGGQTWQNQTGILPDRYPMDIAIDPTDEATAYIVFSGFGSGHVFKTIDYGATWNDISGDLPDIPTNAVVVDPLYPNQIYVGNDFGVYVSTNGGGNWESFQTGLYDATMIFDLVVSPSNRKLRAATHGNGAFERDLLEEVVDVEQVPDLVQQFSVYPNPATTNTTVSFELQEASDLSIRLLTIGGQLVEEWTANRYPAGKHQVPWDCTELPKGSYLLQLNGGNFAQTKKLIIHG
ncbi:MAG: T9SS type A sorting domain-containing protein [Bacteroidota bacterium]